MKLYDLVKKILTEFPITRCDDKRLIWLVWNHKTLVQQHGSDPWQSRVLFMDYINAPASESITRARRKVQQDFPELKKVSLRQLLIGR